MNDSSDVTKLLHGATAGDPRATERLLPLVYDELRRLADSYLRNESAGATLQATALVHEAYLRLVGIDRMDFKSRGHFFAVAATAIRRILVERARRRSAAKRGGGEPSAEIELAERIGIDPVKTDILALNEALDQLAAAAPDKARIVELRFFAGLSTEETAAVLGVTPRTVERHWRFGRAWLYDAMTH